MPPNQSNAADSPAKLHRVSDLDRASAISAAILQTTGCKVVTSIYRIDYSGMSSSRGPFRRPTCIGFSLLSTAHSATDEILIDRLRSIDDETLAIAMTDKIGDLAGESYDGFLLRKKVGNASPQRNGKVDSVASFDLLIALRSDVLS